MGELTGNKFQSKCERIYSGLKPFNIKLFRQKIKVEEEEKEIVTDKISELFTMYINKKKLKHKTKSHYKTTSNILNSYKPGLSVYDITSDFLSEFEEEYKKKVSLATVSSYLRNLRSVINYFRYTEKIIDASYEYPFGKGGYSIPDYYLYKDALPQKELELLINYEDFEDEKQRYAVDIWKMLYFMNGSNFVDLLRLKWTDVNFRGKRITFIRKKTETTRKKNVRPVVVPIIPDLQKLLEKYGNNNSTYVLGKINENYDETTFNNKSDKLKKMINSELLKISKKLDLTHDIKIQSARNCYAATLRRKNVPIASISKMLNHSNTIVTQHYIGDLNSDEVAEINNNLVVKNVS